jgi:hypothetical protein
MKRINGWTNRIRLSVDIRCRKKETIMPKPKNIIQDAPWVKLTYTVFGLAKEVHNELR